MSYKRWLLSKKYGTKQLEFLKETSIFNFFEKSDKNLETRC